MFKYDQMRHNYYGYGLVVSNNSIEVSLRFANKPEYTRTYVYKYVYDLELVSDIFS